MDLSAIEEITVRYNNGRPAQIYRGKGLQVFIQRIVGSTTPEPVYENRRGRSYMVVGDIAYNPTDDELARAHRISSAQ